jgi:putative membrane protein
MSEERTLIPPIKLSRTLTQVALMALAVAAYGALAVWKEKTIYHELGDIPAEIHAALTLVLGWLLVFRTNTAYNRWWEARTLWGGLVNASRNLAAKLALMIDLPEAELREAVRDIVAFPCALRDHLRDEASLAALPGFEKDQNRVDHLPSYLVGRRYQALRRWRGETWIDGDDLRVIDRDLAQFLDICGSCERIRGTRVARSYRVFARQCVIMFLATLPWGIAHDFGWWTLPLTAITAYFMIGMETVAEHVEEPFGRDEDDLDLDAMCDGIAQTVGEIVKRRETARDSAAGRLL